MESGDVALRDEGSGVDSEEIGDGGEDDDCADEEEGEDGEEDTEGTGIVHWGDYANCA